MTELCRKCGEALIDFSLCAICRETIQQTCSMCRNTTQENFHQQCKYQLHILKLFPIPPDTWFEKGKRSVESALLTSDIKNKKIIPINEKNDAVIAIAKVLESIGKPVLERVCSNLYSKYNCYLIDCYDNPEYLADVLREIFGASYKNIIKTIEENVKDYESKDTLVEFLAIIKSTR